MNKPLAALLDDEILAMPAVKIPVSKKGVSDMSEDERDALEFAVVSLRPPETSPEDMDPDKLADLAEEYFERCAEAKIRPTISGLALSLGLASVSAIERMGQRYPKLRAVLGRALVIIQHGYESQLGKGAAPGLIYALNNIPDGFDLEEPEGSPSPRFWQQKHEVYVQKNISATIGTKRLGADLTPEESYARVIEGEAVLVDEEQVREAVEQAQEAVPVEEEPPSEEEAREALVGDILGELDEDLK